MNNAYYPRVKELIRGSLILFCLLFSCAVCTRGANAASKNAYFHYHIGLDKAMSIGNIAYLKKKSKSAKYPVQRRIAHIAYLASRMKLNETLSEGKSCFKSKKVRRENALLAISCGVFAAGAALTKQHVAEWAKLVVAVDAYGVPALKRLTGENYKIPYFDSVDAEDFANIPALIVKKGGGESYMSWTSCLKKTLGHTGATAWIQVNHQNVCFLIDTGTSGSVLMVKTARKLGIVPHKGGFSYASGISEKVEPEKWGIIGSLKLGSYIIFNVPVTISNESKFNIIGGNTLLLLGKLLFTAKRLVINPLSMPSCGHPLAYAYKSLVWPLGPVLSANVNDQPARILFDSGLSAALFAQSKKYLKNEKVDHETNGYISSGHSSMSAYSTHAMFSLGSLYKPTNLAMIYAPEYRGYVPLRAGFDLLKHYNVSLNFVAHTACFLPAG